MSVLDKYFGFVSIWTLILAACGGLVLILCIPGKFRLTFTLALTSALLLPAIMPDLGPVNAFAKGIILGLYPLIAVAAVLDPSPRRSLPMPAWGYLITALMSFMYIWTVRDFDRAVIIRIQWLFLVFSALLTARVASTQEGLERVLRGLAYGFFCGVVLCVVDLVIDPKGSFLDVRRFAPFGGNPLQSGLTFGPAVAFFLYFSLRSKNLASRPIWLYAGLLTACLVVIGISRSIYGVVLLSCLPLLLIMVRRVRFAIMAAILMSIAVYFVFNRAIDLNYDRLFSLESERWSLMTVYAKIASKRPIFGLAGTEGLSWEKSDEYTTYAHNAYLSQIYLGGLSYLIPLFLLAMWSVVCSIRVWLNRARTGFDPLIISVLVCMLAAVYLHGFTDVEMYFPAYIWAWLHIFIAAFMMSVSSELSARRQLAGAEYQAMTLEEQYA